MRGKERGEEKWTAAPDDHLPFRVAAGRFKRADPDIDGSKISDRVGGYLFRGDAGRTRGRHMLSRGADCCMLGEPGGAIHLSGGAVVISGGAGGSIGGGRQVPPLSLPDRLFELPRGGIQTLRTSQRLVWSNSPGVICTAAQISAAIFTGGRE